MLAPVMAVFVMALFWKGMTRGAAIATLFLAIPMLLIVFLREMTGILARFNIFNLSAVIFLVSLGFIWLVSKMTAAPGTEAVASTVWKPALLRPTEDEIALGYPLWKRIGFWFTILVICFTVIYAVFW